MGSEKAITHQPCSDCGSSDGLTVYEDHSYCFVCEKHRWTKDKDQPNQYDRFVKKEKKPVSVQELFPQDKLILSNIRDRGIAKETCEKYSYFLTVKGNHVAEYRDASGVLQGQKIRVVDPKSFSIKGNVQDYLFGMHLFGPGKMITVTEGELDCLSYSQVVDNRWPCVSVPNGAQSAKRAVLKNLSYLCQFEKVVFMFDMDEPGRKAAQECSALIPGGKGYIATLPLKDANEMLMTGRTDELAKAVWNAQRYTPSGIVMADQLLEELTAPVKKGYSWAWQGIDDLTCGRLPGSLLGIGAATGAGKSDLLSQQIAHDIVILSEPVALFSFEQSPVESVKRIASKVAGKKLHLPGVTSDDGGKELLSYVGMFKDKLYLYDSYGSSDWLEIENTIKYLNECCDVNLFYIDNLTFLTESGNAKDSLELVMKSMAKLVNDLQCVITFVSHLSTPSGGLSHENGARINGRDFKDSRTVQQLAFALYGLERDQQNEDLWERHTINFRILKDRLSGTCVGECVKLHYNSDTGILTESTGELPFSIEE